MKKTVYIETSIPSYLTARPSRDIRAAAWQQITSQWWDEARHDYELFTSELVVVEASAGDPAAAARRLQALQGVAELQIDREVQELAEALIAKGGVPAGAEADALHIAVATVHRIDYLLTWNFRHIDNAATKLLIRVI
jgi:predicted nucleic acid-binding protein